MLQYIRIILLVTVGYSAAWGQASQSPISSQGIGDIHNFSLITDEGKGGIGISAGNLWYLNNINPALLPLNALTVFQAGLALEKRSIFTTGDRSSSNSGGNLNYLATAFPVVPGKWTTSIGLKPFSTVEYDFTSIDPINGSDGMAINNFSGTGGFNEAYWANGVKLGRSFFAGVRASFLFSSITRESSTFPLDSANLAEAFKSTSIDRVSVSDIKFSFGAVYMVDSIFNSRIRMNIGTLFDLGTDISASRFLALQKSPLFGLPFESDTIKDVDGSIHIPASLGFGISFSRGHRWTTGIDVKRQTWTDFENFDGENEGLSDAIHLSVGGEYTPDITSVSSFLKRVTYRAGINYAELPFTINGNQISEVGINFGMSLPVGRYSSLDLSMRYGRRGDVSETTIEEEVLRFGLGITFNDQWFIRRKYD